ncbi:anti-sigma factor [Sinomonas mesophila]|uniref:anti-sigma factor n=1 Tax=Sinomonas mesophila TaxID=1531955 RepID=UPI000985821C|nr:anti-sigma factor [Sinomonas mesophila]
MDDQLHLLTGAYALNALDDDERARFEGSLAYGHPTAQEARELAETAALLASGATPKVPPSDLKARLMSQIEGTPQFEAGPRLSNAGSPLSDAGSPPARADLRAVPPAHAPRLARPARWLPAAAAVLLAAALGAGTWGLRAQQERDDALRQLAAAQGAPSAVMGRILAAPDARLREATRPEGGTLLIAHSRQDSLAGVMTLGLPAPGEGKVYELWLIDAAGNATPAGLIVGDGTTWNELTGGVGAASYLGVTVEPAGGSPHPTTKPVMLESIP